MYCAVTNSSCFLLGETHRECVSHYWNLLQHYVLLWSAWRRCSMVITCLKAQLKCYVSFGVYHFVSPPLALLAKPEARSAGLGSVSWWNYCQFSLGWSWVSVGGWEGYWGSPWYFIIIVLSSVIFIAVVSLTIGLFHQFNNVLCLWSIFVRRSVWH